MSCDGPLLIQVLLEAREHHANLLRLAKISYGIDEERKPGRDECQRDFSVAKMERKVRVPTPSPRRSPQSVHPPIPGEALVGVLIRIESPPGVGSGILRIVRRSEIGDQGLG